MGHVDHFLEGFFTPGSVAVVGATRNPMSINYQLTSNLVQLGFEGKIYPVNTSAEEICGIKAFPRLSEVPDPIDLVVTAVPASSTLEVVRQCDSLGIKQLVIVSGGFSEGGKEGRKLHNEIESFIRERGIRTLGPNTLSPINTANNLAVSFNRVKKMKRGGLSFAFQSGFYDPKINWLFSGLGINKILDMGNKMNINEVDALEYFGLDPDTRIIAMHIESLRGDAREFYRILKKVSAQKPTIILKSGRTRTGSKVAASHTGAIAGENDLIFDGMIKQTAAIRAQNQEEFFDLAKAFEFLEPPRGGNLAIIMMSGGEGVMATDACEMNGLKPADLGDDTYQRLKKIMPPWEMPRNPFDLGVSMQFHMSDPVAFFDALSAIPEDENVHCGIMQMTPNLDAFIRSNTGLPDDVADSVLEVFTQGQVNMKRSGKPFILWRSSLDKSDDEWIETIESRGMPVFRSSERAIRALAAMNTYRLRSTAGATQTSNSDAH